MSERFVQGLAGLSQGFIQALRDKQDRDERLKESAEDRALRKLQLGLMAQDKGLLTKEDASGNIIGFEQDPKISRMKDLEQKAKWKSEGLLPITDESGEITDFGYDPEDTKRKADVYRARLEAEKSADPLAGSIQQAQLAKLLGDIQKDRDEKLEKSKKMESAKTQKAKQAEVVTDDIQRALSKIESSDFAAGPIVGRMKNIGGPAYDLNKLFTTIKANASFDKLQAMREASPTGGALGNVSEKELGFLQSAIGEIDPSMNPKDLVYNLKRINNIYMDIIHGEGDGPERYDLKGGGLIEKPSSGLMKAPPSFEEWKKAKGL